MKKYLIAITAIIAVLAIASAASAMEFDEKTIPGLKVTDDLDTALKESQSQNKSVAIIFDQDSCRYCDMFKNDVLSNASVQKELNDKYVVALVDINKHPDIGSKYKIFGTPSVQFLDSSGKEIGKIEGYVDAKEFSNKIKGI